MKLNRNPVVTGLVTGLVTGALVGGGVALASTGATPAPAAPVSAGPCHGAGTGHFRGMYGMGGMWSGQQPVMKAAADYLGLGLTQLHTQLQTGKSLADIATAQGRTVSGLKNKILAAMTSRINASTTLTAEQKAAMFSHMKDHLDAMINMDMDFPHASGTGMGGMGSWMNGAGSTMSRMWR